MNFKNKPNRKEEFRLLTSCIFKGMSNAEIARSLNYSRSCIAYKVNQLFNNYNVDNRIDFIVQTLGGIINTKKNQLSREIKKTEKLNRENKKLKKILKKIIENEKDDDSLKYWLSEARKI